LRALLCDWLALDRPAIRGVDSNDRRQRKTGVIVRRGCEDVGWRTSVFAVSDRQQGEDCRKEIRPSPSDGKDRHHLHTTRDYARLVIRLLRLPE